MSKLSFTKDNRIEDFTFIIARKDFYKHGIIKGTDVNYKSNFNGPDEISLRVYKNDVLADNLWDRINDYNILIVPELGDDGFFEMDVDLNEDSEGLSKTITGTSLAEAELSHSKIYNYEVNTEAERINDKEWNANYLTVLYRDLSQYESDPDQYKKMKHVSLLHRLLDKLPNYTIAHVDATLLSLTEWYQFSWDDTDVYSILTGDVAEQYHVYFKFNSRYRTISVYDLYSVCNNDNCSYRTKMLEDRNITTRYRGDFRDKCPYCGSTNVTNGYGKFTKILVSKDNLTTSASVASNKDSLINSFKIKSGDDLMDAAVMNQNPNGSNYIYQFSEENKAEMPPELVSTLEAYNVEYDKYYNGDVASGKGIYSFTSAQISAYNALIDRITGHFTEKTLKDFIKLKSPYIGYQSLAAQYYSVLDLLAFFETSMTPDVETNHDSLEYTKALLEADGALTPLAVMDPSSSYQNNIENAVLQSANCIINTALYDLKVNTNSWTHASSQSGTGTWKGTITIETIEYKNTEEAAENTTTTKELTLTITGDVTTYVKQRVEKLIARKDAKIKPLTDLTEFAIESDSPEAQAAYKEQLHYYSLNILEKIVEPAFEDVLSIVQDSGNRINELYYKIYYDRTQFIQDEIVRRQKEVNLIKSIKDIFDTYRNATKNALNFQNFLGTDLYNMFCNYRREDTYSNQNYISDTLTNNEIMRRAGDLLDTAQKELYKASNLQFEVSGSLNNLLALPEFAPIRDEFEVGNWIHMSVADKIYNLRLLSYQINFNELQSIDVEFSTVEKIWSGASDIQSVLKSAGSIAGSYSNTQSQVRQYADPVAQVKGWVDKGLEATKTKFVDDNTTQEIVYDSSGFYARGYDEITGTYLKQQIKINKNGLYTTKNNWKTIDAGIGAISYYNPDNGEYIDDYGVIAKTVVGKLFLGEKLKIYSGDGTSVAKMTMDGNGLVVTNGTASVKIDPNASNIFQILKGNLPTLYADTQGNITLTGAVTATSLDLTTNNVKIGASSVNGLATVATSGKASDLSGLATVATSGKLSDLDGSGSILYRGDISITESTSENVTTTTFKYYDTSGNLVTKTTKTNSAGKYVLLDIPKGTLPDDGATSSSTTGIMISTAGLLKASNALIYGTVYAHDGIFTGKLYANGGYIGNNATNKIAIGTNTTNAAIYSGTHSSYNSATNGFYIGADYISLGNGAKVWFKNDGTFSLGGGSITYNGSTLSFGSGVTISWTQITDKSNVANKSDIPTDVNQLSDASGQKWSTTVGNNWIKTSSVYAQNLQVNSAKIQGTITADAVVANISISSPTITGGSIGIGTKVNNVYPFQVTSSGVLTATGAMISGDITATNLTATNTGTIGPWNLSSSGLAKGNLIKITKEELFLSTNQNKAQDSIYLKVGGGRNCISVFGNKADDSAAVGNHIHLGWLNHIDDVTGQKESDYTYAGWGVYCSTDLNLISNSIVKIHLSSGSNSILDTEYIRLSRLTGVMIGSNVDVEINSNKDVSISGTNNVSVSSDKNASLHGTTTSISGNTINLSASKELSIDSLYTGLISFSSNYLDTNTLQNRKIEIAIDGDKQSLRPRLNATSSVTGYYLGTANFRWDTIYAKNSTISTSDQKDKDILGDIPFAKQLIMSLQPKTYMWKDGDHRRTRMGFVAQDVASSCKNMNENLALFTASYIPDPELGENDPILDQDYFGENVDDNKLIWGLSYHEFIAPMVAVIQQQQQDIDTLKQEIKLLKGE